MQYLLFLAIILQMANYYSFDFYLEDNLNDCSLLKYLIIKVARLNSLLSKI